MCSKRVNFWQLFSIEYTQKLTHTHTHAHQHSLTCALKFILDSYNSAYDKWQLNYLLDLHVRNNTHTHTHT